MMIARKLLAVAAVMMMASIVLTGVAAMTDEVADATKSEEIILSNAVVDQTYTYDTDTVVTITGGWQQVQFGGMWFGEPRIMTVSPTHGLTVVETRYEPNGTVELATKISGKLPAGSYVFTASCSGIGEVFTFTVTVSVAAPSYYYYFDDTVSIGRYYVNAIDFKLEADQPTNYSSPTIVTGPSWLSISTYGTNYLKVNGTPTVAGTFDICIEFGMTSASTGAPLRICWTTEVSGIVQHIVTYNYNGILGSSGAQYVDDGSAVTLRECTYSRAGYTFIGWKADGAGSLLSAGSSFTPAYDVVMFAQWEVSTYTITFNANGGSCSTTSKEVTYDSSVGALPTPTRTGFTFDGWYTTSTGGAVYTSSKTYLTAGNTTLYAHWSATTSTVNLSAGAGSVSPTSMIVTYGSTYSGIPTPTPAAGYVFNGWYTASSGGTQVTASTTVTATASHTLYARYTQDLTEYTISFNSNGGSGAINALSKMINQTVTLPTSGFTKTGCYLSGWTLGSTTGASFALGEVVTATGVMTFYAIWTESSASLDTLAPSTAVVGVAYTYAPDTTVVPWSMYRDNSLAIVYNQPLPEWLTINRQSTSVIVSGTPAESGLYTVDVSVTFSGRVYAVFWTITVSEPDPDLYTVTYDINGGAGSIPQITGKAAGDIIRLNDGTGLSMSGKTLIGWSVWVNSAEVTFNLGSLYTVPSSDSVLSAVWSEDVYIVSYNANGGSGTIEPFVASNGGQATLPSAGFTREGYTLRGWYLADDSSAIFAPGYIYTVSGAVCFYAYWTSSSTSLVSVQYNANGGTGGFTQQVGVGMKVILPSAGISKADSVMGSWNTAADSSGTSYAMESKLMVSAQTVLYAQWVASDGSYTVTFNLNGGSGAISPQVVTSGGTVTKPSDPMRDQYIFTGWRAVGGAEFAFTTEIESNVTLEAQWTQLFTISVTPGSREVTVVMSGDYLAAIETGIAWGDGTTTTKGTDSQWSVHTFAADGTYRITVTAQRTSTASEVSTGISTSVTGATTTTYTVTFVPGGGASNIQVAVSAGSTVSAPEDPERYGATFTGWYTSSACTTAWDWATAVSADLTLYAGWQSTSSDTSATDDNLYLKILIVLGIVLSVVLYFVNPSIIIPLWVLIIGGYAVWRFII